MDTLPQPRVAAAAQRVVGYHQRRIAVVEVGDRPARTTMLAFCLSGVRMTMRSGATGTSGVGTRTKGCALRPVAEGRGEGCAQLADVEAAHGRELHLRAAIARVEAAHGVECEFLLMSLLPVEGVDVAYVAARIRIAVPSHEVLEISALGSLRCCSMALERLALDLVKRLGWEAWVAQDVGHERDGIGYWSRRGARRSPGCRKS